MIRFEIDKTNDGESLYDEFLTDVCDDSLSYFHNISLYL